MEQMETIINGEDPNPTNMSILAVRILIIYKCLHLFHFER